MQASKIDGYHQQVVKTVNSKLDNIEEQHHEQLEQLGKQIDQSKDIKIQDQPLLFNSSQFDFDDLCFPEIEPDQEITQTENQNNIQTVKELLSQYIKSGKALLRSLRNYTGISNNGEGQSNINGSQMMSQDDEKVSSLIKTQGKISTQQKEQPIASESRGNDNYKQMTDFENTRTHKTYSFIPDREIQNHCRKTLGNDDQQSKKKYNILTQNQIQDLRNDLRMSLFTKSQLLKKYGISPSTLIRFVNRFNAMPENEIWSKKRSQVVNNQHSKVQVMKHVQAITPQRQILNRRLHKQSQDNKQGYNQFDTQNMSKKKMSRSVQGNSPNNLHFRFLFIKQLKKLDVNKIIFVDQLRFLKLTSDINQRSTFNHPVYGNVKQVNFVIAINNFQIVHWRMKQGRLTNQQFIVFMKDLTERTQGYTFIMDNHKIHKSEQLRNMVKAKGIKIIYLPPCSEQLNPISFFYEEFCKNLLPRLGNNDTQKFIVQTTHKLLLDEKKQAFMQGYYNKSAQYWKMAEKKQMFPFI